MTEIVTIERRVHASALPWLLPLWFAVGCVLGAMAPGFNWQLFSIGALPGVWAAFLVGADESMIGWLVPTLVVGVPVVWLLGRLLDRLGTDLRLWFTAALVVAGVAGYLLLQGYTDLDAAFARHGSFWAFLICSLQLGSYGATLLLLIVGAGSSVRR
mgnify:FL=1|tara:strand:+ start:18219 stop:18689 length:471 start_codon:yes stop_codon:yes gene_type:complete